MLTGTPWRAYWLQSTPSWLFATCGGVQDGRGTEESVFSRTATEESKRSSDMVQAPTPSLPSIVLQRLPQPVAVVLIFTNIDSATLLLEYTRRRMY